MITRRSLIALALALAALAGCGPDAPPPARSNAQELSAASTPGTARSPENRQEPTGAPPVATLSRPAADEKATRERAPRDLAVDEARGGHTLARHTGRSDAQLLDRLDREREISAASTYTDRPTAERVVGAALFDAHPQVDRWLARSGPRPNLTVHYRDDGGESIGRSIRRGRRRADACDRALVVLKWDDRRHQYFVLTSYPEAMR